MLLVNFVDVLRLDLWQVWDLASLWFVNWLRGILRHFDFKALSLVLLDFFSLFLYNFCIFVWAFFLTDFRRCFRYGLSHTLDTDLFGFNYLFVLVVRRLLRAHVWSIFIFRRCAFLLIVDTKYVISFDLLFVPELGTSSSFEVYFVKAAQTHR